jgi:pimeloyl-ACP methyl ester carboxylesterase
MVSDVMGTQAPPELLGIHLTWPFTVPPDIDQAVQTCSPLPSDLSADERRACEQLAFFYAQGGHFAAWEQPQLFADEVRAGFRSLR